VRKYPVIFTPLSPCKELVKRGNKKIQFPPLSKGRVREGSKIFDTSIMTFQTPSTRTPTPTPSNIKSLSFSSPRCGGIEAMMYLI